MQEIKLSIIIVNYNVRHFLEQCLHSVLHACQGISCEVFVVDNNSVDGSVEMVRDKFPSVRLIPNKENLGFSKANNQAIKIAAGEFILLLNPDTLLESDTLAKTVGFMEDTPLAGALGVKMLDGKGKFLPESKRGLPTPDVAFYKIFGLSKIFPKSKLFGRYHLGYLDNDEIHEVDILSGAYMLLRKEALDKTGYLDETFFMYGEDIDLSYRIIKAGYKNYYYPKTRIIHYKGESTKKSSVNYVFTFYNAMIIFARKHFSSKNAKTISLLIHLAIYLRAFTAIVSRFLNKILLPLCDLALVFLGIFLIEGVWEQFIFGEGGHYPLEFTFISIPVYIIIWLFSVFMAGGYDKPVNILKIIQGLLLGTLVILVLYSLLPEVYRFSRALILLGAAWAAIIMSTLRLIFHYLLKIKAYQLGSSKNRRFVIVGEKNETERVAAIVRSAMLNPSFIGLVGSNVSSETGEGFIGNMDSLTEIIQIYKIDEAIFCGNDIPAAKIIDIMSDLQHLEIDFKIAPPGSLAIIGSKSISTGGDLYIVDINSISTHSNKRKKFFLDFLVSIFLLSTFPVSMFVVKKPVLFLKNILLNLLQQVSWVGYHESKAKSSIKLPAIKKGILNPTDAIKNNSLDTETIDKLNLLYARDYKINYDLNIIIHGFRDLGRNII
jgi:GT2 family glycosyltransferase